MPYENGKVFHITRNGVKYGASQNDIARALGSTNLDTGSLCTRDNIKIWPKFKPMPHDTPIPYTNAQRKQRQWGLVLPVGRISTSVSSLPFYWEREKGSGWYVLDDFVGDNEGEGYFHNAPPTAQAIVTKSGNFASVSFVFNNDATNCGITPSDLQITNYVADGETMANLYPGAILYEQSGVMWVPKRIYTTNTAIGTNSSMAIQIPLSFGGTDGANQAVVPIFSKVAFVGGVAISTQMNNVLFAHDSWYQYKVTDANGGRWLFTHIGGEDQVYFTSNPTATPITTVPTSSGRKFLLSNTTAVTLTAKAPYEAILDNDARIALTLTFLKETNGKYGMGSYCPISNGQITSLEAYQAAAHNYDYRIFRWEGGADLDEVELILRYKFHTGACNTNSGIWNMTFIRQLVVKGYDGEVLETNANPDGWAVMTINGTLPSGNMTVTGQSITQIRACNRFANFGSFNERAGLDIQMRSGSDYVNASTTNSEWSITVPQSHDIGIGGGTPAYTWVYVDVTVDTIDTVGNNELFNFSN